MQILGQPLAVTGAAGAHELLSMLRKLTLERSSTVVGNWLRQKQYLLVNMSIWEWLSKGLEDAYEQEDQSNEIGRLLQKVETILHTRPASIRLDASDFLPNFVPHETIFELEQPKKSYISARVDKAATLALASSILQTWFQFPSAQKYETQAWFVRELVDCLGPNILLLNDVWKAAHNVNIHVLGIGKDVRISRKDIQDWSKKHLAGHPLTNPNSQEYITLCTINAEINAIISASEDSIYQAGSGPAILSNNKDGTPDVSMGDEDIPL